MRAIETIGQRGNITRHAATLEELPRCGVSSWVMLNHREATIPSDLEGIQCGNCVRLLAHDDRAGA